MSGITLSTPVTYLPKSYFDEKENTEMFTVRLLSLVVTYVISVRGFIS